MKISRLVAPMAFVMVASSFYSLKASAQVFLEPVQSSQPTWLGMGNGQTAIASSGSQGNINNSSNRMTQPGATFDSLTSSTPGKLSLPGGRGGNNLLAPNSVGPYGSGAGGQPVSYGTMPATTTRAQAHTWNAFPSDSYTYGFPTSQPPIPGGIYKGQDTYLPPTSTSSVDLNIVDRSGTQYPLPIYTNDTAAYAMLGSNTNSVIQSITAVTAALENEFEMVAAADIAAQGVQIGSNAATILASVQQLNSSPSSSGPNTKIKHRHPRN